MPASARNDGSPRSPSKSSSLPSLILQGALAGLLVEVHLELGVVIGDGVAAAFLEDSAGPTDDELTPLLQEISYVVALQLGPLVVLGDLLDGIVDLVEVGHLGFDAHLLDCAAVAAPERVYSIERPDVEILWNGHLDQF